MKEITIEFILQFLKTSKFAYSPTHKKLSYPVLLRIYNKLKGGERFRPIHIYNNIIVDGHHRYVCLNILNREIEILNWTLSSSSVITSWDKIEIENIDWDHPTKHTLLI
ncbi:MAG: hypothetical protein H7296_07850 [Bacteroidia bacterium]|nr:hypothetical protein [Bacteroidia bacterium]